MSCDAPPTRRDLAMFMLGFAASREGYHGECPAGQTPAGLFEDFDPRGFRDMEELIAFFAAEPEMRVLFNQAAELLAVRGVGPDA